MAPNARSSGWFGGAEGTMTKRITKHHAGKAYEWDGSGWVGQDDRTVPPLAVVSILDRLLTAEDWIAGGRIPPFWSDEQQAAWYREQARMPGAAATNCFCRRCGQFVRPPGYPMNCHGQVSLTNRSHCEFCGAKVAGDALCPDCHRAGERR